MKIGFFYRETFYTWILNNIKRFKTKNAIIKLSLSVEHCSSYLLTKSDSVIECIGNNRGKNWETTEVCQKLCHMQLKEIRVFTCRSSRSFRRLVIRLRFMSTKTTSLFDKVSMAYPLTRFLGKKLSKRDRIEGKFSKLANEVVSWTGGSILYPVRSFFLPTKGLITCQEQRSRIPFFRGSRE